MTRIEENQKCNICNMRGVYVQNLNFTDKGITMFAALVIVVCLLMSFSTFTLGIIKW